MVIKRDLNRKEVAILPIKIKTNASSYTEYGKRRKSIIMMLIFKKIMCSGRSSSCQIFCLEIKRSTKNDRKRTLWDKLHCV